MSKPEIEIKPLGSYFEIDNEGYLINPTSKEKIKEKWKPAILDLIEVYKTACGDFLVSIYIRGSVAKGESVEGVSDLDSFAYVDLTKITDIEVALKKFKEINYQVKSSKEKLENKYPFITHIEAEVIPLGRASKKNTIMIQSLCVYGKELHSPKLKIGKDLYNHRVGFENTFESFERFMKEQNSKDEIKKECSRLMKRLLRVGLEITMEKTNKYSRDLYKCYENFSQIYPEKEPEMREVLFLALNPTSDIKKIDEVLNSIGKFLEKKCN